MHILHTVELYHPSVGGAQEVVKQISEKLVERGHQVTVATRKLPERVSSDINGVRIEEFEITGNAVSGMFGETRRYQEFLIKSRFDIMMNYAAQEWAMDLALPILDQIPYPKVMIPCGFSRLYDPSYSAYFARMPEYMRKYNRLVFHAQNYRDIDLARHHRIENVSIIPNGASKAEFSKIDTTFRGRYGISSNVPLILTVGNHLKLKGHQSCIDAYRKARIGPSVLLIVGGMQRRGGCLADCRRRSRLVQFTSLGQKRVTLIDPSRLDVVAAFHAADLFVFCSLLEYSPLVLFEALASKTAFISSNCGNANEIAQWTGGGIVIPSTPEPDGLNGIHPDKMAREIESMIGDAERRIQIANQGYRSWKERYTWEIITGQYESLYLSLLM